MKKTLVLPILFFLAASCARQVSLNPSGNGDGGKVACTQEAKLCPDGSYVGRSGPDCEFTPCPAAKATSTPPVAPQDSGIQGSITLGPTCPVERIPPDPNCAPRAYQASVKVESADGLRQITQFTSAADGKFKVSLNPGVYLIVPISNSVYPRGQSQQVTVKAHEFTQVSLQFDSGIR